MSLDKGCTQKNPNPNLPQELRKAQKMAKAQHSLGAESALLLQLPVPEDGGGRWDGVDGAGERLRRAILVGVDGGQQCVLADLGGDWRREQQVTPPAKGSPTARRARVRPAATNPRHAPPPSAMQSYLQGHVGKR